MKKAVLVGINYSNDNSARLNGCIQDTQNVRDILISKFGYKPSDITMINDFTETKPTKDNIIRACFEMIQGQANNDVDQFFFQYSGHGAQVPDRDRDESDNKDEVIVPIDYKTEGLISDDLLFNLLVKPLKSHQKLTCLIDACNSGTMLDLKYNIKAMTKPISGKISKPYDHSEWNARLGIDIGTRDSPKGNVLMISGCQDHEQSNDVSIGKTYQGMMTYCFLDCLRSNDCKIKLKYLVKDINCLLDLYGFKNQNSQLSANNYPNLEEIFEP
ncbi:putative viral metacaspase 1 [Mimivirus AB-566-O17]|uniref:Putative viral metacaspase 1 n=1 Tax=Mimivirus AB-566-O17 TaxID=1988039 RepID=A0A1X9VNV2_9VIRU|nr:putative viral metacaspase 1 [Mimivirus AB-566-O17]